MRLAAVITPSMYEYRWGPDVERVNEGLGVWNSKAVGSSFSFSPEKAPKHGMPFDFFQHRHATTGELLLFG